MIWALIAGSERTNVRPEGMSPSCRPQLGGRSCRPHGLSFHDGRIARLLVHNAHAVAVVRGGRKVWSFLLAVLHSTGVA